MDAATPPSPTGYELFDHTADIGIRVFAPTMDGLIAPAALGLYAVIGELATNPTGRRVSLHYEGNDEAALLRDFLADLLLRFETNHQIVSEPRVQRFDAKRLELDAALADMDNDECQFDREVKAVTYHELAIRRTPTGFEATLIVDI
jgi:SHS2 domain-containing protein